MAKQTELLTTSGTAALLGVSESTVRNLITRRQLQAVILPSGHRRLTLAEVSRFLRKECTGKARINKAKELVIK